MLLTRALGARPFAIALAAIGLQAARVFGMSASPLLSALLGGLALGLLATGVPLGRLGLAPGRWLPRLIGTAALTAVLLLPAAVRWTGQDPLGGWYAPAAVVIAAGEELAFRGALFDALEQAFGGAAAVLGSSLAWTLAHAFSHPPAFLPAVLGAGLVLGLWRLYMRDLAAPIAAHALADLAL